MRSFLNSTGGAALVEYGLLGGLVAVVAIGSVSRLGSQVEESFQIVSNELAGMMEEDAPESRPDMYAVWTITAEANPSSGGGVGYSNGNFGAAVTEVGSPALLERLLTLDDGREVLSVNGDRRTEFAEDTLWCEGVTLDLSQAQVSYIGGSADFTQYIWSDNLEFTDGESYTCGLIASGSS